ncbi:MAG TPA: nucleotidyltransferase domain-containing protein [Anaerolineales bacterium]|nr:nucleotidyltransferase domain-containing protein [Anaerolineales bacterium]
MVAPTRATVRLSSREKKAIKEFLESVRKAYGENLLSAALFGSRARGDSGEASDIDLLLIVKNDHWKIQQQISRFSSDVALKYDVALDVRLISAERWKYYKEIRAGLFQNIERDAVPFKITKKQKSLAV